MRKRTIWLWGVGVLLLLPHSGQAQPLSLGASGINWATSTLTITDFQAAHPSHEKMFSCFGDSYENLPISQSFLALGWEDADPGPLTLNTVLADSTCFQQAGVYGLVLKIFDRAGNHSQTELDFRVVPSKLDLQQSSVLPVGTQTSGGRSLVADIAERSTCTSPSLVADGEDACLLEVRLQDRFSNIIKPDGVSGTMRVQLQTDEAAENLDASQNLQGAFLQGLYFNNRAKQANFSLPSSAENLQLGLKAYVPSLAKTLETENTKTGVRVQPATVKVDLAFTNTAGVLEETTKIIKPLFSPWVAVTAKPRGGLEQYLYLPLNRLVQVPFELRNWPSKALPDRLTIDWAAVELPDLWVRFQADSEEQKKTLQQKIVTGAAIQKLVDLGIELVRPEGASVSQSLVKLQPTITYPQITPKGSQLVRYPLSLLDAQLQDQLPDFRPLQIQASIEGRLLSQSAPADNPGLLLAGTDKQLFTRWRDQIYQSALALIRGQKPRFETVFNLSQDFGEEEVAYFKNTTVHLSSDDPASEGMVFANGVRTIIIEDGNLVINRDLAYGSPSDSLGVILINSNPQDTKNGHVFVHQNVQRLVGSYFLDGALISTQKLEDPLVTDLIENRQATNNQSESAPLALQLVLEGTVFSRNTLGGADKNPSVGLNGQELVRDLALIYDLNYLRRYEPMMDAYGDPIPDADNLYCVKQADQTCYPNYAPTIIRYDGRGQTLPPPGFGGN